MSFILDTCVISELAKPRPNRRVVAWVDRQVESSLHLSVLTLGEIEKGIAQVREERRRQKLRGWVRDELRPRFSGRILAVSEAIACEWGRIQGECKRRGEPVPVIDSLLAATAVVHDATFVTRNTGHIERTGAKYLDPWLAD